jgi:hypothetical protein
VSPGIIHISTFIRTKGKTGGTPPGAKPQPLELEMNIE